MEGDVEHKQSSYLCKLFVGHLLEIVSKKLSQQQYRQGVEEGIGKQMPMMAVN